MNDLSDLLSRLAPFKLAGIGLVFAGLFIAAWIIVADVQGLPYRYWNRYCVFLERKLRRLFVWSPGSRIATGQLVGMFVVFAMWLLVDLPYWWVFEIAIAITPAVYIEWLRKKRVEEIEKQLDGFMLALSNALKATPSLGDAFMSVQSLTRVPLQQEIGLAVKEMRVGSTLDQALILMANRIGSRQVDSALSALLIGRQIGGNLPKILETTSSTLREMVRLEAVIRSKTAEGKAQLGMLSVFPIALMLAFNAVKEGYFEPLMKSFAGFVIVIIASGCWIASLVLARKIVDVDV